VLKNKSFDFRVNTAFEETIMGCRQAHRPGQAGTWISDVIVSAYTKLHHLGYAHSAETWQGHQLVGGLYGIRMGKLFFGESMFSSISNASKFAFIHWVQQLQEEGVCLIDCQVYTQHLESLGACMISRDNFINILQQHC